jgi:Cu2+-exporting ATPase
MSVAALGIRPQQGVFETERETPDPSPFVRRSGDVASLELAVFGAKCAGCIAKIEKGVSDMPGVASARLNLSTGKLAVSWRDAAFDPRSIIGKVAALGYRAAPFDPARVAAARDNEGRDLLRALAVAGFAAANVMLLSVSVWSGRGEMGATTRDFLHWVSAAIAMPAAAYAGRPFFGSALASLKAGRANMDVPISLAVVLALSFSLFETAKSGEHAYFDAAVMLLFFLLIGRYLDHRLRAAAKSAARDLLALQAPVAARYSASGVVQSIAARDIAPGDILLLAPGDRAPVNGEITEGASSVDLSIVTGESAPAKLKAGDRIDAGALNVSSRLVMRATATVDDSLLADLARLIEAGEQSKSRYVKLADRAARLYVPVVHSLAAATFCIWQFALDAGLRTSLMNAIAVLIITCPCALGLAAPVVQIVATGRLFRRGVLVKSGDALERLARARTIVFDKTGTLTHARLEIANRGDIPAAALEGAARLARGSRHPMSRAIAEAAGAGPLAGALIERDGFGVEGVVDGKPARLGRAAWCGASAGEASGSSAFYCRADEPPVRFEFRDRIREDAREVVDALRRRGLSVAMLSGDQEEPARRIAEAVGGVEWRARLTPKEKVETVERMAATGDSVAMIGDGLNDAPALAAASVSMSPGTAAGASQAAADFIYLGEALAPVVEAVDVSRKARRLMLQNFAFAALYNLFAAPLAAFGFVTPLIAALAMSGSSVFVTLNAMRLARGGKSA